MEEIKTKIQELVADLQVQVMAVSWQKQGDHKVLEVQIDRPNGVDMNLCALVSAKIDAYLDEAIDQEAYYLDVCSCGVERFLQSEEELKANSGKYVIVTFKEIQNGLMSFKGDLGIKEDKFTVSGFIKGRKKTIEFDYQAVEKIQLSVKI